MRNRREEQELRQEADLLSKGLPEVPEDEFPLGEQEGEVTLNEVVEVTAVEASETAAEAAEVKAVRATDRASWLERLKAGLSRSRQSLQQNLGQIFGGRAKIDEQLLEELHAALYRADIGVAAADSLVDHVRRSLANQQAADPEAVTRALKERAAAILSQSATHPLNQPTSGPWVILVVGVNGVGKTTTIGKLAAHFLAAEKKVLLAAADTFRAAAIEQLSVWGERLGVDVVKHKQGADPAAVAYDGVKAAVARGIDVLMIDTAGRLHAKQELMDELGKINRIIGRDLPGAPHETWLVIDATTGQNALQQVKAFSQVVKLSGLIVTKLDGTAKGGVLLSIAEQFKLPIRYVGVGESAADLRPFNPADFADSLF
ncbi:MAG: signal recognition particle-docking protein FtsY [Deltaproteobacteria bacterium]|nr:signal recognition particle-docking protein FtsY [Deltaproteobacteria bacterium]